VSVVPREPLQSSTRPRTRLCASSLIVLVGLVTACGGDGSDGSGAEAATETTAETTSTTAESTTTTRPRAADGTDLAACADGNCEVEVSAPVDIPLTGQAGGITMLSVTEVTPDDFSFTTVSNGGGTGSGGLSEGCIARQTSNGGSSMCPGPDPDLPLPVEPGVLAIQPVELADGTAVLRLASG
jgi:hypothetical protein